MASWKGAVGGGGTTGAGGWCTKRDLSTMARTLNQEDLELQDILQDDFCG